jgi:hypothetical protein
VSLVNAAEGKSYPLSRDWVSIENVASPERVVEVTQPNSERWKLVARTQYVDIFENSRVLPRAWLVDEARRLDEPTMLEVIRTGKFPEGLQWNPLKTVLIDSGEMLPTCTTGEADVTRYEPNRIEVKTSSEAPAVLVLSENHYPGWQAKVDGQSVEVMRVNYNQRGVALPAGKHLVTFVYRPKSVLIGFVISLLTLGLLVWWAAGARLIRSRSKVQRLVS